MRSQVDQVRERIAEIGAGLDRARARAEELHAELDRLETHLMPMGGEGWDVLRQIRDLRHHEFRRSRPAA